MQLVLLEIYLSPFAERPEIWHLKIHSSHNDFHVKHKIWLQM